MIDWDRRKELDKLAYILRTATMLEDIEKKYARVLGVAESIEEMIENEGGI